jgi:hypothetical protein
MWHLSIDRYGIEIHCQIHNVIVIGRRWRRGLWLIFGKALRQVAIGILNCFGPNLLPTLISFHSVLSLATGIVLNIALIRFGGQRTRFSAAYSAVGFRRIDQG